MSLRMGFLALVATAAFAGAACGSSGEKPGFMLTSVNANNSEMGFDVNAARVVMDGPNDPAADFFLGLGQVVGLSPTTPEGGFCQRGTGLTRVEQIDVPADLGSCTFAWVDLGVVYAHQQSYHAGEGYIVKDSQGVLAGRLLLRSDRLTEADAGTLEVTFDFLHL